MVKISGEHSSSFASRRGLRQETENKVHASRRDRAQQVPPSAQCYELTIEGDTFEVVEEFVYLGSMLKADSREIRRP